MRLGKYDVYVFKPGKGDDYDYEGVHVYRFRQIAFPCGLAPFVVSRKNGRLFLDALRRVGIQTKDIAICHVHTLGCAPCAIALKRQSENITTLLHLHQLGTPFNLSSGRFGVVPLHADLLFLYYREVFETVDRTILLSKMHAKLFGMTYPKGPLMPAMDMRKQLLFGYFYRRIVPKHIDVVYNGIDTKVFYPHSKKKAVGKFTIGCVANFGRTKDQITLIKAFEIVLKSIPDAQLRLVGTGECLEECENYVNDHKMNLAVRFEQEFDHLKLPEFYNSLDLFVLPTWAEGFCCTLIEAAGCGIPIMSCKGVSVEEVIPEEDKNIWLFTPRNYVELANKIVSFYNEPREFRFNQSLDIDFITSGFMTALETCSGRETLQTQ